MTDRSKIWDYDPKEITKLLSEFAKPTICEQLGIGETTLKNYIKAHQIQYTKPPITRKEKAERKNSKPKRITVDNNQMKTCRKNSIKSKNNNNNNKNSIKQNNN